MFREEENHVALFIDWDNLAISTAADFGGASPDVRAIVHTAQRYGTLLLARAYAEWQVPSDRLAVYRAGIDPIYAPTFRFEPDPVNQAPRGKSLADPCLVADCIDTLHLMPTVTHFVLVSGDKDLIPIVRLAQLRGRRVVVIGPDYVAAILREMADEYISYRSLVESKEPAATPEAPPPSAGGRRRRSGPPPRASVAAPAPAPAPVAQPVAPVQAAQPAPSPRPARAAPPVAPPALPARPGAPEPVAPPAPRPALLDQPTVVEFEEPSENGEVVPVAVPAEVEAPELPQASPDELKGVLAVVEQILHEREAQGKPRLRATNLKDLLMARIAGFNERRYGFGKFKDLLAVAEKSGVLEVNRTGPVHWVTLPRRREEPAPAEVAPAPEPQVQAQAQVAAVTPAADAEHDVDLISFIVDLRDRSRWLTYTYVLTNLISHLAQTAPSQSAESEARNALSRLVQAGILRIDREPREIEVAGTRHRVRMCHLEENHPLVQAAQAAAAARASEAMAPEAPAGETPEQPSHEPRWAEPEPATAEGPSEGAAEAPVAPRPAATVETAPPEPAPRGEAWTSDLPPLPEALLAPSSSAGLVVVEAAAPASPSAPQATQPAEEPASPAAPEGWAGGSPAPEAEAPAETAGNGARAPTLAEVFGALREVVRQATGPGKAMAGAASVKTRLGRRLGAFDERTYGFGKFKDFLLAAQREGYVLVESAGPATRVALPAQG